MKIAQHLVRFYPYAWRSRYEEELLAYLEQSPISFSDGLNLLYGAVDAHLHPQLGTIGLSQNERMAKMLHALRCSLLTIFCAYAGFIIAGLAFQKMTEDGIFIKATGEHSIVGISFMLVAIGSIVALLGVLVGGLPIAATIIKYAMTKKRPGQLFLMATPIAAFIAFLGTLFLLKTIHSTQPLTSLSSRVFFIGAFLTAIIVSTSAICFAFARSEIAERLVRFALHAAMVATASMVLMLIATISWGLGLWSNIPQLLLRNDGIFGSSTTFTWIGIVAAMAMATSLALIALIRGFSARATLSATRV